MQARVCMGVQGFSSVGGSPHKNARSQEWGQEYICGQRVSELQARVYARIEWS
jgi:hypothetical protein